MSTNLTKLTTFAGAMFLALNAHALEFGKPLMTPVVITKSNKHATLTEAKKDVALMTINLSPSERSKLLNYHPKKSNRSLAANISLPSTVQLGMNNVPVLNQGWHGTCVTFATTAAIDAVIGKGDYISQLCSLELGDGLESKGYMPSGWQGSFGPWVIDQLMRFGVVSKEDQRTKTCATVSEYPLFVDEGKPMSLGEYSRMSENITNTLYVNYYMNFIQRFDTKFSDTDQADAVLTHVKKALSNGHRLTFGTFIVLSPYCSAGACASHNATHDTWALTKELEVPPYGTGGHEMVITGYDDNATAMAQDGTQHQGLLTLRNSWGDDVGDGGNYYMTYDYFKKFVGEVQEIVPIKN